jgi:septal ring factor EnvC (AmiA/AmiB activator)
LDIVLVGITVGLVPKAQRRKMSKTERFRITEKRCGCLIVKECGSKRAEKYWIKAHHADKIQKLITDFNLATIQAEYLAMEKKTAELETNIAEKTQVIEKVEKLMDITQNKIQNMSKAIHMNDQRLDTLKKENKTLKTTAQRLSTEKQDNHRKSLVEYFDNLIHEDEETIDEQLDIFEQGINRIKKDFAPEPKKKLILI